MENVNIHKKYISSQTLKIIHKIFSSLNLMLPHMFRSVWNQQLLVLRVVINIHTRIPTRKDIVAVCHLGSVDFK